MSQILSSAYAGLVKLLSDTGHFISPAELQGILWGRVAAGAKSQLPELSSLLGDGELTDAIKLAVTGLQEMINKEFSDGSVAVTLLLPIDDESLEDRIQALIDWGSGFLSGFGMIKLAHKPSKEVLEILTDLDTVTQLQTNISPEDKARSEGDYMELVEFLRVVPLLVATELNSCLNKEPTVH